MPLFKLDARTRYKLTPVDSEKALEKFATACVFFARAPDYTFDGMLKLIEELNAGAEILTRDAGVRKSGGLGRSRCGLLAHLHLF